MRCIMDIEKFFVNTLFDIDLRLDVLHSFSDIESSFCQSDCITLSPSFHSIAGFHPLTRLSTRQQFSPPKPKLFFKHTFTWAGRATLGT